MSTVLGGSHTLKKGILCALGRLWRAEDQQAFEENMRMISSTFICGKGVLDGLLVGEIRVVEI